MTDEPNESGPNRRRWVWAASMVGAGVLTGIVLTGAMAANAATTTPTPSGSSGTTTAQEGTGGSANTTKGTADHSCGGPEGGSGVEGGQGSGSSPETTTPSSPSTTTPQT
jgi:hypothetical protein